MQTNPVKAIREKCLDCCCFSAAEVSLCSVERCPLYPFRFGKNPYRAKREMTAEQLKAARERMQRANAARIVSNPHLTDDAEA